MARVLTSEDTEVNFKLLDALNLPVPEVLQSKSDTGWAKKMDLFKKHVLGISSFSKETVIENQGNSCI